MPNANKYPRLSPRVHDLLSAAVSDAYVEHVVSWQQKEKPAH